MTSTARGKARTFGRALWRGLSYGRGDPAGGVVFIGLALFVPYLVGLGHLFFWTTVLVAVLFATTVNLLFGVADIPSFGQAAFFGAGAYTVAMLAARNWSVPLALLAAIAVGGLVALGASIVTWRATGLAFAMLTLAIAQGLYTLVINTDGLGGYNGLPGIVATKLGPFDLVDQRTFWYFTLACVCVGLAAFWQIGRSPFGHVLASIRENPVRAAYLGINVRAYRALAFTLAGCGAGLAGGLSAYANQIVTPSTLYWTQSATPIIMLLLGGRSRFWGPTVGAVIMTWLLQYLGDLTPAYIFYVGLILLAVLTVLPQGILSLPGALRDGYRGVFRRRDPARSAGRGGRPDSQGGGPAEETSLLGPAAGGVAP